MEPPFQYIRKSGRVLARYLSIVMAGLVPAISL
jgi:hypothetical protein